MAFKRLLFFTLFFTFAQVGVAGPSGPSAAEALQLIQADSSGEAMSRLSSAFGKDRAKSYWDSGLGQIYLSAYQTQTLKLDRLISRVKGNEVSLEQMLTAVRRLKAKEEGFSEGALMGEIAKGLWTPAPRSAVLQPAVGIPKKAAPIDLEAEFKRYEPRTPEALVYFKSLREPEDKSYRQAIARLLVTARTTTRAQCQTPPKTRIEVKGETPVVVPIEPEIEERANLAIERWATRYLAEKKGDADKARKTIQYSLEGYRSFDENFDEANKGKPGDTYATVKVLEQILASDPKLLTTATLDRLLGR